MEWIFIGLALFVWLFILPIALPIHFGRKCSRFRNALVDLYDRGVITRTQYINYTDEAPPYDRPEARPVAAVTPVAAQFSAGPVRQTSSQPEAVKAVSEAAETTEEIADKTTETADETVDTTSETPETTEDIADETTETAETTEETVDTTSETTETTDETVDTTTESPETTEEIADKTTETAETADNIVDKPAETPETEVKEKAPETSESAPESIPLAAREAGEEAPVIGGSLTPIRIILGLAVAIICTAGAIGIASVWGTASDILKLLAVGSFSIIFYGAFRLAHNVLKISDSAKAFYILSIATLGITATAAELFGMILGDASPTAKMMLPAVVIAAGMFRGFFIFRSRLFQILGILFVFLFLTALSSTIFSAHAMMFFIPTLVATGGLAFVTLSKNESITAFRKPAIVIFILFTSLLMLSTYALHDTLHQNLMAAFALTIAVLLHIQLHKSHNCFVEWVIPVVLCWASLSFIKSIPDDFYSIALLIGCVMHCVSTIALFQITRKQESFIHPATIFLYAVSIGILASILYHHAISRMLGIDLFIPALTYLILGAHQIPQNRAFTAKTAETKETAKSDKPVDDDRFDASINNPGVSAWLSLIAGVSFILAGYKYTNDSLAAPLTWYLNLGMSALILVFALIPEKLHIGDSLTRRYTSFFLLIILALWQFGSLRLHTSESPILAAYPFNQLIFLVPAFALALVERFNALKTDRRYFAIASHCCAFAIVLWIVPLLMLMLDVTLKHYLQCAPNLDLQNYIIPVDAFLLAGILLYEPKAPLCPDLSKKRLITSTILLAVAYFSLMEVISSVDHLWIVNLCAAALLLALSFVPARFLTTDVHSRRCMSFVLMILFALRLFGLIEHENVFTPILSNYPLNQLIFLVPAFALAIIERFNAIKSEQRQFAITAHVCANVIVLWVVPLLMLIMDDADIIQRILNKSFNLSLYIVPVDAILLAIILLYEPKASLCPKLSLVRLVSGATLIGLSYISFIVLFDSNLTGNSTHIRMIPWIATAIYLAIILFYTFRKRIAHAEAPHIRLRAATALCTTMSLAQLYFDDQIAAALLLPALAITVIDDRRSARLSAPNDQTIAAVIASILFSGLTALVVIKLKAFFNLEPWVIKTIQDHTLPAVSLLWALFVLAEHIVMGKRAVRPYRLVLASMFEISAACALLWSIHDFTLPMNLMILVAGLIATGCMSYREHRKYGAAAALAIFIGLYKCLDIAWSHLETAYPDYFVWMATAALTAGLAFVDGFRRTGYTPLRVVWAIAAFPLFIVTGDPYHIAHLAGVLILALNLLQYLRERGHCDFDRILITISTGIIAVAVTAKILILPEDVWLPVMIRPELIGLVPLATAYLVSWRVWGFREPLHDICSMSALIILPLIYIIPSTNVLFHASTVAALAIVSIIAATRTKLNRYLAIGIINILIIFFSQTKNFWAGLHQAIYWAIVGVILLAIGVIYEMERRKGSTLAQFAKRLLSRTWKW